MSYIDHITEFLFDEQRRLSSKAAVVVFVILSVLFIDNMLGFSYYFNTNKKIEQIQKINEIIKDSATDSKVKTFAENLRHRIMYRENIIDKMRSFIQSIKWENPKKQQGSLTTENTKKKINLKSDFWFQLSASGIWYLTAFIILPIMIFTDKKTSLFQRIATGILGIGLFWGLALFFFWICSLIPQISATKWIWNYLINLLIQLLVLLSFVTLTQKKK